MRTVGQGYIHETLKAAPSGSSVVLELENGRTWRGVWLGFQEKETEANAQGSRGGFAMIKIPRHYAKKSYTNSWCILRWRNGIAIDRPMTIKTLTIWTMEDQSGNETRS
jgi:hypothetical protein